MDQPATPTPVPPYAVLQTWALQVEDYLGGRANRHWLVRTARQPLVLRRYQAEPLGDIGYELRVLDRLAALGWPVPVAVAEPITVDGHRWCLFTRLPGHPPVVDDVRAEQLARGRLLAELHADLESLADLGQRPGCSRADVLVGDPGLIGRLRAYELLFPQQGRVLRWHAERAAEIFAGVPLADRPQLVVHGDFLAQNLLYQDGRLSGIVDFEGTHLNHRVSDFALSWRGRHDDVVRGYQQLRPLDGVDRALLAPALWAWTFLGVAGEIDRMLDGRVPPHGLDWQVRMLLRRSPLMGELAAPYPKR